MCGCDCLQHIYGWVCLFGTYLWVGMTVWSLFIGGCYWVWVGVNECGWVGKMVKLVCNCLKCIYGWVYFSRRRLWVGVTVYSTFMGGCAFLDCIYEWMWLFRAFLWVCVAECGWVGNMVQLINRISKETNHEIDVDIDVEKSWGFF